MMCGITCLQIVCKPFSREVSLRTLSKLCVATSVGVSMLGVNEAANKLGLRTMCARTDFDTLNKVLFLLRSPLESEPLCRALQDEERAYLLCGIVDKGKVMEIGNHEALTAKRGAYYNLVKNQLELGN